MEEKEIPVKYTLEDIGIGLLESITRGLYLKPLFVIREYVQNAVDAEPNEIRISVVEKPFRLIIHDDGYGMDKEEILTARKIGISEKSLDKVGFRGIGIWSGLAVSDLIKITTTKKGSNKKYLLVIESRKIKKEFVDRKSLASVLNKYVRIIEMPAEIDTHYTEVEIHLNEEYYDIFKNKELLTSFIGTDLPTEFDPSFRYKTKIEESLFKNVENYRPVRILFQGDPVYKPYVNELEEPNFGIISKGKEKYGYYWVALHQKRGIIQKDDVAGMIFKIKGFTVGDRNICNKFIASEGLMNWVTGEIHITHKDIIPNSERTYFEYNTTRDILETLLEDELQKKIETEARNKSKRENAEKTLDRSNKDFEGIKESFDKIEPEYKILKIEELKNIKEGLEKAQKDLVTKKTKDDSKNLTDEIDGILNKFKRKEKIEFKRKKKALKIERKKSLITIDQVLKSSKIDENLKKLLKITLKVLHQNLEEDDYYSIESDLASEIGKEYRLV